jgi:hypothetical protein
MSGLTCQQIVIRAPKQLNELPFGQGAATSTAPSGSQRHTPRRGFNRLPFKTAGPKCSEVDAFLGRLLALSASSPRGVRVASVDLGRLRCLRARDRRTVHVNLRAARSRRISLCSCVSTPAAVVVISPATAMLITARTMGHEPRNNRYRNRRGRFALRCPEGARSPASPSTCRQHSFANSNPTGSFAARYSPRCRREWSMQSPLLPGRSRPLSTRSLSAGAITSAPHWGASIAKSSRPSSAACD